MYIPDRENIKFVIGVDITPKDGNLTIQYRDGLPFFSPLPTYLAHTRTTYTASSHGRRIHAKELRDVLNTNIQPGDYGVAVIQHGSDWVETDIKSRIDTISRVRLKEAVSVVFEDYNLHMVFVSKEHWAREYIDTNAYKTVPEFKTLVNAYSRDLYPELNYIFTQRLNVNSILIAKFALEFILKQKTANENMDRD